MRNVKPSLTITIFILLFTFFLSESCKKDLSENKTLIEVSDLLNAKDLEKQFFKLPQNAGAELKKIATSLRQQENKKPFITSVAKDFGIPVWEKAIVKKIRPEHLLHTEDLSSESEDTSNTALVLLPVTYANSIEVNAVYACEVKDDSVNISFYSKENYSRFGYANNTVLNAEKIAGLLMYIQNKLFGTTSFAVKDNRIFKNPNTVDTNRLRIIHFNTPQSNTSSEQLISTEDDYAEVRICYTVMVACCGGQLCHHPQKTWIPELNCSSYWIYVGNQSLAPPGNGTGGNTGGGQSGGGAGEGGSEPFASVQSILTQVLGLNSNQENFLMLNNALAEQMCTYMGMSDGVFTLTERKVNLIQHLNLLMSDQTYLNHSLSIHNLQYSTYAWGWSTLWCNQITIEGSEPVLHANIQNLKLLPQQAFYLLNNPSISSQINQFLAANNFNPESKFQSNESIKNAINGNPFILVPFVLTPTTPIFDAGGGNGAKSINNFDDYIKCFTNNNNKPVSGYKFAVFAEQPSIGTRQIYSGSQVSPNPGHSFIMLERTYTDGTKNNIVIGFYPSSTVNAVLNQNTLGRLMDNEEHDYNVKVEKEIDQNQFNQIIAYIKSKETASYNLQTFNCTDFAIEASTLAGINFPKTSGCWYQNSCGVSPANLGQDMIENKFTSNTPASRISFTGMTKAGNGDGPCQ